MPRKKTAINKTISSAGYVLLWMPDHHLSDVRGYVYEHRLNAEAKIGRRLTGSEEVHHINGNKQDNHPENLMVLSAREHRMIHRKIDSDRRKFGESNPIVECACGCGETFPKYDSSNRPRVYVSGHNPQSSPTTDAIMQALKLGPLHRSNIASRCGKPIRTIAVALSKMKKKGIVQQKSQGIWSLVDDKKQ